MTGDAADHGGNGRETRRELVVTGLAQHDPVIVLRLPSIQRMAPTAKQPPAAAVAPVLTPTTSWYPSSLLVLCPVPATGSVALGAARMLANTGTCIASSTMRTWPAAVETVASS
jgi:hypothetical protein